MWAKGETRAWSVSLCGPLYCRSVNFVPFQFEETGRLNASSFEDGHEGKEVHGETGKKNGRPDEVAPVPNSQQHARLTTLQEVPPDAHVVANVLVVSLPDSNRHCCSILCRLLAQANAGTILRHPCGCVLL